MPDSDREPRDLVTRPTGGERLTEAVAVVASAVPSLGGPVSAITTGIVTQRKMDRVAEILEGLASELEGFQGEVYEQYLRTEDFEELLEETLVQAARERTTEKRDLYKRFLVHAIRIPGDSYDEQIRHLRTLDRVQPAHVEVLAAMLQEPDRDTSVVMGSPGQTLSERLSGEARQRHEELVADLNELRVTNFTSLRVTMTGHGAQDLRHHVTAYGRTFIAYILEADEASPD